MFTPIENIRPFIKAAFEGFAGDGKTFTAVSMAIGLHKAIKSQKPIALLDTEKAAKALIPIFEKNGIAAIVNEGRSLANLNEAIKWCENGGADILVIDSITHVWEEFLEAHKASKRFNKTFLEFQDWGVIKPRWKREFSTPFVNAKCHIIFTGRAGYEYEHFEQIDGATGKVKKEIQKSGIKMKAEGETAFEPDLLFLMGKVQDILGTDKRIYREALVLKDRTTLIDGQTFKNPTYKDFEPAINQLLNGVVKDRIDQSPADVFEHERNFDDMRKERDLIISSVEGHFNLMGLGTGATDKKYKAALLKNAFNVVSIDELSAVKMESMRDGMSFIRCVSDEYTKYLDACKANGITPEIDRIKDIVNECKLK